MYHHGRYKKATAFLLLLVSLHVAVHSLMLSRQLFEPLQEELTTSLTCSMSAGEDETEPGSGDFKPPKHSFIDYASYFCPERLVPIYQPAESRLIFAEPFRAPPQVYQDIFVPPQNFA